MCFTYERRYRDKIQAALLDWAGPLREAGGSCRRRWRPASPARF